MTILQCALKPANYSVTLANTKPPVTAKQRVVTIP